MSRVRTIALGIVALCTLGANGCSLCCSPYVDDYVTFGSRTPRMDMKRGRVGSIFSDPNAVSPSAVIYDEGQEYVQEAEYTEAIDEEDGMVDEVVYEDE